ncbi:nuclear pore complex protein Nup205 [Neocloeon triangulifer]|uniref:nuclear pore complex protein Nup205 n=1 Tax=Neocloeon triangulifer TaxID=2078957 RepID=UPI00286F3F80|nr:nuclear pore complex protein Nup205 [Neocloeon triangulifer]
MVIVDPKSRGSGPTEDLWTPYKELHSTISSFLAAPSEYPSMILEENLKNFKQTFLNLLRNTGPDPKSRQELQRCVQENTGLPLRQPLHISRELLEEAIIISDMFSINEYVALDLLCVAEQQMQHYPELTRGLVAVMLFYDGRKAICDTLCLLAQARRGVSWEFAGACDNRLIAAYMDQLVSNNLVSNILDLLSEIDVNKEMEKLQRNRGLGGPKHQRLIYDLITGTRQTLADIVFCLSAQAGLPQTALLPLIKYISEIKMDQDTAGSAIDGVNLALVMALLYALDVSILQRKEEQDELVQRLPLVSEHSLIPSLMRDLSPMTTNNWGCKGLQGLAQMAWGLALCSLRMAPASIRNKLNLRDDDELLIGAALDDNLVFEFLYSRMLSHSAFAKEEFYVRRMHTLFTDLLILMPMKVKEMRNFADEAAKVMSAYIHEGLQPPKTLPHHFEHLMLSMALLYENDKHGLGLEFWGLPPMDGSAIYTRTPVAQNILSKFANLTKESLPSSLYVPYLKFLASLAKQPRGAQHIFQLLNANNDSKCTISWSHFYRAMHRYASNLSQETQVSATDSVYRPRGMPRGINPQELMGLHGVLALIRAVADNDPMGRQTLAQNPSWSPVQTFLALIRCAVPIPLKAEILLTVASLAKSSEVANEVWQQMESTNIICTAPSSTSYQPKGLQTELEEVETRNEEYPLSRATLKLLNLLVQNAELPLLLGVGKRPPGLSPHMYYALDCVFLPFLHRTYRKPEERWQVAENCLELLHSLLSIYEPNVQDIAGRKVEVTPGQTPTDVAPHPGFSILVSLNSPSPLIKLVLQILDEACLQLEKFSEFPGKSSLEKSARFCLSLLHLALSKLPKLTKAIAATTAANTTQTLVGLDKLIFNINPRTGHQDHPINIIKFLTYAQWLPGHASLAIKFLTLLASNPGSHHKLLQVLAFATQSKQSKHAFVDVLDFASSIQDPYEPELDGETLSMQLKEDVLDFLAQSLAFPPPTVAHLLLGYEIKREMRHTVLQHAGVLGFPRTCLHSIIQNLDSLTNAPVGYQKPNCLHERGFAILHVLCSNPESARPTLKYLRLCSDFLSRHLIKIRSAVIAKTPNGLHCASWLLRCIAIDLKLSSSDKQKSSIQGLLRSLLSLPVEDIMKSVDATHLSYSGYQEKQRHGAELIAMILQDVDFTIQEVEAVQWRFFDHSQIELALKKCEFPSGSPSEGLVDISKLSLLFRTELSKSSAYTSQRDLVNAELKEVLNFAAKVNKARGITLGGIKVVGAWRHVVGVLFNVIPMEFMPVGQRHRILLAIIKLLLTKIQLAADILSPEVASLGSSALLLLLASLRQCHLVVLEARERTVDPSQPLLDNLGNVIADPYMLTIDTPTVGAVLSGIAHWLNQPISNVQMLRANLYGSLLVFLHLACFDATAEELRDLGQGLGGSSLYFRRLAQNPIATNLNTITTLNQRRMAALEALSKLNENWINSIFVDAIRGHEVCRMLALSMIAALFRLSPQASWTVLMINKGYLQSLIESITKSDPELLEMLRPSPTNLKPLYVYEAKMALLCRLVQERPEAEACLRLRLLSSLSELSALDCRPFNNEEMSQVDIGIPGTLTRYHQILMPALKLCSSVLNTMGNDNMSCVHEVTHFMISHGDVFQLILRGGSPNLPMEALQELNLVVKLLSICSHPSTFDSNSPPLATSVCMQRLKQFAMALLPKFYINQHLAMQLSTDDPQKEDDDKCYLLVLQIALNLLTFARRSAIDHHRMTVLRPVFKPAVSDSASHTGTLHLQAPDLGLLLSQVNDLSLLVGKAKKQIDLELARLNSINVTHHMQSSMSTIEPITQSRQICEDRITRRKAEMRTLCLLTEECLHLLWAHLDLYLRRNLPRLGQALNDSLFEPGFTPTVQDLSMLKQGVLVGISDRVEAQILEATKDQPEGSKNFLRMLLRRIKRLVQFAPV